MGIRFAKGWYQALFKTSPDGLAQPQPTGPFNRGLTNGFITAVNFRKFLYCSTFVGYVLYPNRRLAV